jgi:hypothetical protein
VAGEVCPLIEADISPKKQENRQKFKKDEKFL